MSGIDRISLLHESQLTTILSYLTTKEAVRTSTLSKRWTNVWASVPVLHFDFSDYWSYDMLDSDPFGLISGVESSECHANFVRIIDSVIGARQVETLDSFSLVWRNQAEIYPHNSHPVRNWILLVLQKKPRVLSIYVQPSATYVVVPDLICSSLEEMKLHIENKYPEVFQPMSVNLPCLRRLDLGYFTVEGDVMNNLLLGCPGLEELELNSCALLDMSQISCGNLKSLVINGCLHSTEIRVSTPSLQYLKITVMSSQTAGIVLNNSPLLSKACLCFLTIDHEEPVFTNSDAKILNGLLSVTNLNVVLYGLDAQDMLEHTFKNCPHFENLKAAHFESFDSHLDDCIDTIASLIQHSPVLEDLTIYRCENEFDTGVELMEELREELGQDGKVVESKQGHIYRSVAELEELSSQYMKHLWNLETDAVMEEENLRRDAEEQ